MEVRFQFSVRNALIATALFALWCLNWTYGDELLAYSGFPVKAFQSLFVFLLAGLPATFVGSLRGRHVEGILYGAVCGLAVAAWVLFE